MCSLSAPCSLTGSAPLLDGALVLPPRLLLLLDEGHEELPRDLDGEARDEGRVGQDDREEDLARLRLRVVHLAREQRRRVSGGRRQRERDKSQTDRQIDVTLNLQSSLNLTRGLGWSGCSLSQQWFAAAAATAIIP